MGSPFLITGFERALKKQSCGLFLARRVDERQNCTRRNKRALHLVIPRRPETLPLYQFQIWSEATLNSTLHT